MEAAAGIALGEEKARPHLLGRPEVGDLILEDGGAVACVLAEHGPGGEGGVVFPPLVAEDAAPIGVLPPVGHHHLDASVAVDVAQRRRVHDQAVGVGIQHHVAVGVPGAYRPGIRADDVHPPVAIYVRHDRRAHLRRAALTPLPLQGPVVSPKIDPTVQGGAGHLEVPVPVHVSHGGGGEVVVAGAHRPAGQALPTVVEGVNVPAVGIGEVVGGPRGGVLPEEARAHDDVRKAVAVQVGDGRGGPDDLGERLGPPLLYGAVSLEDVEEAAARPGPVAPAPAVRPDDHLVLAVEVDVRAGGGGPHRVRVVVLPGHGPLIMPGGDVMPPGTHHDLQVAVAVEVAAGGGGEDGMLSEGGPGVLGPPPLGELLAAGVQPIDVAVVAPEEDLHLPVAVAVHGERRGLNLGAGAEGPADGAVVIHAVEMPVAVPHQDLLPTVSIDVRQGGGGVLEDAPHVDHPFLPPMRRAGHRAHGLACGVDESGHGQQGGKQQHEQEE